MLLCSIEQPLLQSSYIYENTRGYSNTISSTALNTLDIRDVRGDLSLRVLGSREKKISKITFAAL